jgi:TonB family protein
VFSKRTWNLLLSGLLVLTPAGTALGWAQPAKPAAPFEKVTVNLTILIGFPGSGESVSGTALLVPGTVIPLDAAAQSPGSAQQTLREKSQVFAQAVEKLWSTFRLDPARRLQKSVFRAAEVGKALDLAAAEGTDIHILATMLSSSATSVTYRVLFRKGESTLADSTVPVARGGHALIGGMDGDAAPYIFLLIAPELPEQVSKSLPEEKKVGITAPVLIQRSIPVYPEDAKKQKISGSVLLEVVIDREGRILDVRIVDDPHPSLSSAAAECVRQWVFKPALKEDGTPVSVRASITINFKLQ